MVQEGQFPLQHATAHANMIAEASRQAGRAIQVRATRHILHMEAQGRAQVASNSHAMHNIFLRLTPQRRAWVLADAPQTICCMYGADALHNCSPDRNPLPRQLQNRPSYWSTQCPLQGPSEFSNYSAHTNEHAPFMTWKSVKQHMYIDQG